jgi:hypothetical protein
MNIELDYQKLLLRSCEKLLGRRDEEIAKLKEENENIQKDIDGMIIMEQTVKPDFLKLYIDYRDNKAGKWSREAFIAGCETVWNLGLGEGERKAKVVLPDVSNL